MKQFLRLLRIPLCVCTCLMIFVLFSTSLMAQTKKQTVPGTFSQRPIKNAPLANSIGLQQFYSATGRYTVSADGIGSLESSMNIRVNKPNADATVEKAILISSVTYDAIADGCVTIAGVPVNWDGTAAVSFFNNYWADVTSIVAPVINALPAGISTLPVTECNTYTIEGEALLVVFNDPWTTEKTVIVMLGGEDPQGDNFSVTLAQPIKPDAPGALLDMGLGIGYSYQFNGTNQASQVSVNGQRISSSAGGEDDGDHANGALLTVGGIGDTNDNPADPMANPTEPRSDDELYSILPFINSTTTSLTISTINPSLDDNIFLAYFVTSGAAIIGEGILLSQDADSGHVGDQHWVKATIVDDNGQPVANRQVMFTVTSGPNAGNMFTATTDADGNASYTYTGSGGEGTDSIQACFTNSQGETSCSNTLAFVWTADSATCNNYCLVDSYGYQWKLCAKRDGNWANATGTVNIDGVEWNVWGNINCNNGLFKLHAINPMADNCMSGYVDSFVYRGYTPTKCNNFIINVGGANWKSYCGWEVLSSGRVGIVRCGNVVQKAEDNLMPAKTPTPASGIALKVSPNPAQNYATVSFKLDKESKVNITVYNYMMQPVKTLFNGTRGKGVQTINWDARYANGNAVNSGLYKVVAVIDGKTYSTTIKIAR